MRDSLFAGKRPFYLLAITAESEADLRRQAEQWLAAEAAPENEAETGKRPYRLAAWGRDQHEAAANCAAFLQGEPPQGWAAGRVPENPPPVAFLCTGQGAQYAGMGRTLYETEPVFRHALEECVEGLRPYLPLPLLEVIFPEDPNLPLINETTYTQPALFAIEYALAQLWLAWGARPAVVLGHSVGEYVAAVLAGVFSLSDGLKLIAARGRLMGALPSSGAMAAVFADEETVAAALVPFASQVAIAALNGPAQTVISGEETAVAAVLATLKKERVRARPLVVSHAFHSPLMEPMLAEFFHVAATIAYRAPQIPLISNVTGQLAAPDTMTNPAYWRDHVRAAVRFAPAVQALYQLGINIFLEIGPQPHLTGMAKRIPGPVDAPAAVLLPSLQHGEDDWSVLLPSWAEMFIQGAVSRDLPGSARHGAKDLG